MSECTRIVAITLLVALFAILGPVTGSCVETEPRAKGIIMLIGDGMGINQVRSAAIYSKHVLGKTLVIDSIRTRGTTTTYSADSEVTDSSSAATALYTGYKINNGVINILPDGRKAYTIGHAAKKAGMSVGIVSTTRLTHATPAAVYGHVPYRDDENLLAEQLVDFEPDAALGGGLGQFIPVNQKGSVRKDGKNPVEAMKAKGYDVLMTSRELRAFNPDSGRKLLGLFSPTNLYFELDRRNVPEPDAEPSLKEMTEKALSIVASNPKGFFIMIEGGRIDHACHSHDIKASIYDVLAFDEAVGAALEFRKTHPDVLVIVTADHETGGLGLGKGTDYSLNLGALKPITASLEYLNAGMEKQPGDIEAILKAGGYELTDKERELFRKYQPRTGPAGIAELLGYKPAINKYVFSWLHYALGMIQNERAGIAWTSFVHTAQPVVTYAAGPGEEQFSGSYDNTDIPKKMVSLLGLTLAPPSVGGK
ncbi:MAG: alkaline phosphatase [Pseudomonadota bacterium]